MQEIIKTVEIMECDYHRALPPQRIMEHAMSAVLSEIRRTGGDRNRLYEACGAVWMVSHMRFSQYARIDAEEELRYQVFPRTIDGGHYTYCVKIYRGGELIVDYACAFVPVLKTERRVLRLSNVDPIWTSPAGSVHSEPFCRLRPKCEMIPCGCDTVRTSDCDINHHMTSAAYLALACNALEFWSGSEQRYMKSIQLDYASEVLPGTQLCFFRGEEEGAKIVCGVKPDGKTAFTARCVFD